MLTIQANSVHRTIYPMTFRFSIVILVVIVLSSCEKSRPDRAANNFQKDKMILALDQTRLLVSEVAWNLDEPWEIAWGPDDHIWITEHKGFVKRLDPVTGRIRTVLHIPNVFFARTPGLMAMVLHPDFDTDPYVYLHYTYIDSTYSFTGSHGETSYVRSRIVRYKYFPKEDTLKNEEVILPNIPGNTYHNGSRMTISSDNKIIAAIGDVGDNEAIIDKNALTGKVLRLNLDGSVPVDNPLKDKYFYSMGHRNIQGIVEGRGTIYASEHGPNNDDELNLIRPNEDYGWNRVEGFCDTENELSYCDSTDITEPIYAWTPTIAPAGLDYYDHDVIPEWKNSLLLTTLKGRSLQLLKLNNEGQRIIDEQFYLQKRFGRFRDLCISPQGDIYLITSNTDWHIDRNPWMYSNVPADGNDRVVKLSPLPDGELPDLPVITEDSAQIQLFSAERINYDIPGTRLFITHCAPCHLPGGQGVANSVPPLVDTEIIHDKKRLIHVTLHGMSGKISVNGMEYEGVMPGFSVSLSDEEISTILNYVLVHLNSEEEAVITEEDVLEARNNI